ncbi:MAG: hypothetical protein A2096_08480 [Spirochaetes bacterium GWF1_41_5]|nr:MAG: hypothetical protein A2096_08480 [Spirochaetes bacterium GWF1_41_5]
MISTRIITSIRKIRLFSGLLYAYCRQILIHCITTDGLFKTNSTFLKIPKYFESAHRALQVLFERKTADYSVFNILFQRDAYFFLNFADI